MKNDPLADINRAMPFSDEAEKGVLSCCLADPTNLIPLTASELGEAGFYHSAHRLIFRTLNAVQKTGIHPDLVTVSTFLLENDLMDKIGGPAVLPELLGFVPTPAHFPHYLEIMRRKMLLRLAIESCTDTISRCYEYLDESVIDLLARRVADLQGVHEKAINHTKLAPGAGVGDIYDEIQAENGQLKPSGYSTPFRWFDQRTGGLVPGNVYLFAGKRGTGKSSIVRQIGWIAASVHNIAVSNFQLEMTKRQEFNALCCMEGVNSNAWLTGEFTQRELDVIRRVGEMRDTPYRIHDDCKEFDQIEARIRSEKLKRNLRIVIIDGPQRVRGYRKDGRERELSTVMDDFKSLAKSLGLSILMPVHINDELVTRGSEDLENLCDVKLLMASRPSEKPGVREVLAKLDKNRFGEPDGRCLFEFFGSHYLFREIGATNDDIVAKKRH